LHRADDLDEAVDEGRQCSSCRKEAHDFVAVDGQRLVGTEELLDNRADSTTRLYAFGSASTAFFRKVTPVVAT
jgi:hypothetical protein